MSRLTPAIVLVVVLAALLAGCSEGGLDTFGACGAYDEAITVHAATNDTGENVEAVVFFFDRDEVNGTYELGVDGDGLPRAVFGTGDKIFAWMCYSGVQPSDNEDEVFALALSGTVTVDSRPAMVRPYEAIMRVTATDLVFENGDEIDELVIDSVFVGPLILRNELR